MENTMDQDNNDNNVDFEAQLAEKDAMITNLQQQFDAVKGKADQLLDETKKAKNKAREEAMLLEQANKEKAEKNGDFEQLLQSSEKERSVLADQLNALQGKVSAEKTRNMSMKLAAELADGANAELLSEFVSKRLRYTDDGLKVLDSNGDLTVSSVDDLKREFENSDRYKSLLRGNRSSGGGATGGSNASSGMTSVTQAQWDGYSPAKRMQVAKELGSKGLGLNDYIKKD